MTNKYTSPVALGHPQGDMEEKSSLGHPMPDVNLEDYIKRKQNNESGVQVSTESCSGDCPCADGCGGKVCVQPK